MISFAIISLIIGAVLLAISSPRKGGDFKVGAKDVETTLPEITGPAKIPAFILGLVLIGIGLWMGITLFVKTLDGSDTQQAKTGSQLTENQIFTPELQPTNTPSTPIAVATNRPSPTSSSSVVTPLQSPWDILLNNWQETVILKQYGDKTVTAVGPFYFKVIASSGNYCGVVTPGTTLDAIKEFGTPLLEHWPIPNQNNLIAYLTMSDGKKNGSFDMEDFCLDPPGYKFVIISQTNDVITMQEMNLPILPGP